MKLFSYCVIAILTILARLVLWKHKPVVIAITGSVGKTTTKDVIAAVLLTQRSVRFSDKSLNSEVGLPLAIFGRTVKNKERSPIVWVGHIMGGFKQIFSPVFPDILVLEVGAAQPGDIASRSRWLHPHVSVFTALSSVPVHIEFFTDRQQLFDEKKQLAVHTRPSGTIIYNSDDEYLGHLFENLSHHKVTVGTRGDVQVMFGENTMAGVTGKIIVRGKDYPVLMPGIWGETYIRSFGLAMAVASDQGLDLSVCVRDFANYFAPNPGRMRLLRGICGSVIIDDSYNASPIAVSAALKTLDAVQTPGRKIFLFGDMKELGKHSDQAHIAIGHEASTIVNLLITVGEHARKTGQAAIESGLSKKQVFSVANSKQAGELLMPLVKSGDIILAKSSRHAIRMEQALVNIVETGEIPKLVQEYL